MSLPCNGSSLIESITVHGLGPIQNPQRVDPSSFVQKLYAFCSYNRIPYSINSGDPMSPKNGRCPWMKVKMNDPQNPEVIIEDSQRCIQELSQCFSIDMDAHLTKDQKVQSENLRYLAEGVLYYCVVRRIWEGHPEYLAQNGSFPVPDCMKSFLVGMIRKGVITTLNTQGNGDLSVEESETVAANIYREFARILGNKKFLFSDKQPSLIDVAVVRFFDKVTEDRDITSPKVKEVFAEHPALKAYGDRLQQTFFPPQEFKKRIEEGTESWRKAKATTIKILWIAASVVVAVSSIGGFYGYKYLKGAGYF